MRIITKRTLQAFWERHPDADESLRIWYARVSKDDWERPTQVRERYANARMIGNQRLVFNIKGNHYRLVIEVNYQHRKVYIRFIGTHAQYDRINAEEV